MKRRGTYQRPPRTAPSQFEFIAALTFLAICLSTLACTLVWYWGTR